MLVLESEHWISVHAVTGRYVAIMGTLEDAAGNSVSNVELLLLELNHASAGRQIPPIEGVKSVPIGFGDVAYAEP